jgi:cell division protein FtsI (penicillin-binding protein 3)
MASMPSQRTAVPKWRINVLLLVVLLASLIMSRQLVVVQVAGDYNGRQLDTLAQDELAQHVVLQPRRGTIYDRNGVALAMNVNKQSLYVDPSNVVDPEKLAVVLEQLTGADASKALPTLRTTELKWARLQRWLEPAAAEQVEQLINSNTLIDTNTCSGACLYLVDEAKREYPQGTFASRVVGVANHEGVGITGVEAFYDAQIRGVTGTLQAERSVNDDPIWIAPQQVVEPQNGKDVKLTIDSAIQKMLEDELQRIKVERDPESATLLAMDPATGEVLGMASMPGFDPNNFTAYDEAEINRNGALRDTYEPGSTMKAIVTAIGLQTGAFTTTTMVDDTGTTIRSGLPIHNWDYKAHGMITPADMMYYSSNVAALQFGEKIGKEQFYKYLELFGYGQPTGIDLGGEEVGIVHTPGDGTWSDIYLNTNSYGHGLGVTALQHLTAYNTLANGGMLMRPHVVKEVCDGTQCTPTEPQVVRQVLDRSVTDLLRPMLGHNSEHYGASVWSPFTGVLTDQPLVPGYRVAAKTGTSLLINETGVYQEGMAIASIAGWAPLEQPRVTLLVKVDRPKTSVYGTDAAGPSFQRLMTQLMRYYRIPPDASYVAPGQQMGGPPMPSPTPSPTGTPTAVPPPNGAVPMPSDPVVLPTPTARVATP